MPPDRARLGHQSQRLGLDAEAIAERALRDDGWAILARRLRTPAGELDLVAAKDGTVAFVEVKARPSWREGAEAVSSRQQRRLWAAAEWWLANNPGHDTAGARFDVVVVAADGSARRIRDAFRLW